MLPPIKILLTTIILGFPAISSAVQVYALTSDPGEGVRSNDRLITIDTDTGEFESVGRPGLTLDGIAFDNEGELFAADGARLYTLDPDTAAPTEIGQYGEIFADSVPNIDSLTNGGDTLYGLEGGVIFSNLSTLNKETGDLTFLGDVSRDNEDRETQGTGFGTLVSATYDNETGNVYSIATGLPNEDKLISISPETITTNGEDFVDGDLIGEFGVDFLDGEFNAFSDVAELGFAGDELFAFDNDGIFNVNKNTGAASLHSELADAAGDPYAIAFNGMDTELPGEDTPPVDGGGDEDNGEGGDDTAEVPSPGALLMMATGLVGLGLRRLRS